MPSKVIKHAIRYRAYDAATVHAKEWVLDFLGGRLEHNGNNRLDWPFAFPKFWYVVGVPCATFQVDVCIKLLTFSLLPLLGSCNTFFDVNIVGYSAVHHCWRNWLGRLTGL
jgi:hypothetical protein